MSTCIHGVNPHASITEISVTDAYRDGMSTRANLYILVPHSYQSFLRTLVSFRGNKLGWTRVSTRVSCPYFADITQYLIDFLIHLANRQWVRDCSGCWAECEVTPSAFLTLDIALPAGFRAGSDSRSSNFTDNPERGFKSEARQIPDSPPPTLYQLNLSKGTREIDRPHGDRPLGGSL
jgi:hypothetical protein